MIEMAESKYCCGIMEMGNFAYSKTIGPGGMPHYHRKGSSWQTQSKAENLTTEEEVRRVLEPVLGYTGGVICSTGADQEYMDEILGRLGFIQHIFRNRAHEKGEVKLWFLAADAYVKAG